MIIMYYTIILMRIINYYKQIKLQNMKIEYNSAPYIIMSN